MVAELGWTSSTRLGPGPEQRRGLFNDAFALVPTVSED